MSIRGPLLLATLTLCGVLGRVAGARPALCTAGQFVTVGAPLLGSPGGAILLADGRVALGSTCPPVAVMLVPAPGGTGLRAHWSTCGEHGRGLRLRAILDPSCTTMRGTLAVRRPRARTRFVATCTAGCTVPAFACLAGPGPVITLTGAHTQRYDDALPAGTRVDARAAVFVASPANRYPIDVSGGRDVCLAGATVSGRYDRTLGWAAMHKLNNAGVRFENAGATIDGARIDDVTDGIRPVAGPFVIRQAWLSYVRDDCIEDDHLHGGLVSDSLFDGCYVAVSERPSPAIRRSGADGRGELLTIERSLIRLQPMPGPRGGEPSELGHGQFFKWDPLATALALHDNVFLAEQVGQGGADTMGLPDPLADCSGNVMVWLGAGAYPAPLPRCFTVRNDRRVWDDAVAAWKVRHPRVGGDGLREEP